ncbi:hypothetical protein P9916_028325 [Serratia nevei]|uniref:hypothetical protein n=1 Tax=Serratia nevei TaxID=2703794 RepID=UPI00254B9457|nr:hypothetical protein [Serratia nevei]MEC5578544.1 hypothetical protein [Serratia nevei]
MASPGGQDAHTRHVGTAWRHKSDGSFIAGTVKAAHPDKDAASVNLNLRQDGSPQGRDSLLALFTTAVSLKGRRPGQYLFNLSPEINSGRDKQQHAGRDVTGMNKEY